MDRKIIEIDVRMLAPPEPFNRIMEQLMQLKEKEILKVIHRREPFPLYEELKILGFHYHTKRIQSNLYEILIYKK